MDNATPSRCRRPLAPRWRIAHRGIGLTSTAIRRGFMGACPCDVARRRGEPGQGVGCLDDHTPWHSSHGKTATVILSRSLTFPGRRVVFRAAGIGAGPSRPDPARARTTGGCPALTPGVPAPWEVFPVHGHL